MGLSRVNGRYHDMNLLTVTERVGPLFSGADEGSLRKLPGVPEL
jgi:hypothetical protein